jgi:hypothetical protein
VSISERLPVPANFDRQMSSRNNLRASVAYSAARLIAEGLSDYHVAKQKAARQLGVTERYGLPDNHEIEMALREHFALFACETQREVLFSLRETAVRVMSRFEQFSPWLVGAVLAGTANEFSEIELELVGVEPKDLEMYLLNTAVTFAIGDMHIARRASPAGKRPRLTYRIEFDDAPVSLALYNHRSERQSEHPEGSIRHDRVQRADAMKRFQVERGKP